MKKILVAIAAVALLSACGTAAKPGTSAPTAGSNRPAATSGAPAPEVTTPAPVASDESVAVGSTKTYEDGLQVTVSKGASFTPGQYAVAGKSKSYVKYTITLLNGTGKVFDPSMFNASVQSANTEGEQVFDSENGMGGGPDTKLLKGRESKFVIGFGIADPKDVVLEVQPGFDYQSVLFN